MQETKIGNYFYPLRAMALVALTAAVLTIVAVITVVAIFGP